MAENGTVVTVSGAALSFILYENVRSTGDQIGLLLGNILTFITKSVTDGDRQEENVKHHINIDTVVTCSKGILKDSLRVDTEKLDGLMEKKAQHVVGWFRFRYFDVLVPSLKDKILHKEFASHFLQLTGASEEHFIMLLLNASTTNETQGTHKYRHVCLQYKQGIYQPIPMSINNLGNNVASYDGYDYKFVPTIKQDDDVFSELMKNIKSHSSTTSDIKLVTDIQKQAEEFLTSIMSKVCQSDEEISKLQQEVNELRAKVEKSIWIKNIRQKEKSAELQYTNLDNERIFTTAQIHGSPRSTHSDDLFDSDQSPTVSANVSSPSNSMHQNLHTVSKKINMERGKPTISKECRNHSIVESSYCDFIRSESSPESPRSKEGTKFISKVNMEERSTMSKRQINSPKNTGKSSERHSIGDFSGQSQDEYSTLEKKEQSPRPTSYSEH